MLQEITSAEPMTEPVPSSPAPLWEPTLRLLDDESQSVDGLEVFIREVGVREPDVPRGECGAEPRKLVLVALFELRPIEAHHLAPSDLGGLAPVVVGHVDDDETLMLSSVR